jgi:hypothetical protein
VFILIGLLPVGQNLSDYMITTVVRSLLAIVIGCGNAKPTRKEYKAREYVLENLEPGTKEERGNIFVIFWYSTN